MGLVEDGHLCQDLLLLVGGVPCDVESVGWSSPNFHDVEPVKGVHNARLESVQIEYFGAAAVASDHFSWDAVFVYYKYNPSLRDSF